MHTTESHIQPGSPALLGARYDGKGVNFAVFSKHADKIELCLFDSAGKEEIIRIPLPARSGDIWHGYLPDLKPGQIYGFRVHGQNGDGHAFNPNKLLLDPYAKEITGTLVWDLNLKNPKLDSASSVPKSVVVENNLKIDIAPRPEIPADKTVIYELHVKGFTKTMEHLPEKLRGTYAGLAHPETIAYLKKMGITTIELLPVAAKASEEHLDQRGLVNYWGYNTIAPFALEKSYAATDNAAQEFKAMVDTLHKSRIEVILDVVFNHGAEHDETGPTLSLRGIDNKTYYRMNGDKNIDMTGCGNTLDLSQPAVRKLVIDCLKYWAKNYNIDGFRFDLATVLARDSSGTFDPHHPFLKDIATDPDLKDLKLIAEPWDVGAGGYQLGQFPSDWMEWNDKFRDDVRKFWRGEETSSGAFATRLAGSSPEFDKAGKTTCSSINMITSHDGFTLADLTGYHHKRNHANGQNNKDGTDENLSCVPVKEENSSDPVAHVLRYQMKRNLLSSLFLAQGTPMLLAGDEHGNSQNGNNNPYCQDNNIGWLNWDKISADGKKLQNFVQKLIHFRADNPVLSVAQHLHGQKTSADGQKDITWLEPNGHERTEWIKNDDCFGVQLNGDAVPELKISGRVTAIFNRASKPRAFILPPLPSEYMGWQQTIDTAHPQEEKPRLHESGAEIMLTGRTVLALKAVRK